ncbi:hatching enzyme 1.2-like [Sardina pilchardus]|uniref:hatching enzyme 1.2-like n=1 Tax=Sardina pilchardus TaxID=27697 RepID=UPI002E0F56EB
MYRKLVFILVLLLGLSQVLAQEDPSSTEEVDEEVDISTRILEANQEISGFLMEGDVAIPRDRNARKCSNCKWQKSPSGLVEVPYNVSDAFSAQKKAVIQNALQTFHEKTCIRFVPYVKQKDFIRIVSRGGCYSYVGRNGGGQTVSLNVNGCVYKGVVQHELLHALGFFHEQTRSDRDKYVKINFENIRAGVSRNFNKYDTNNLNTAYDYGSVMHYSRKAFSKNGNDTITPIPNPDVRIGQRRDLSEIDIVKINRLYECDDSSNVTSSNETLKELIRRLEVSETQVKSLVGQVKSLVSQDKAQELYLTAMEARLRASEDTVDAQRTQLRELQTLNEGNKVAFSLSLETTTDRNSGPYTTGKTLIYKHIFNNVGNAYDLNTGFFTAPVRGVYEFSLSALSRGSNVVLALYLRKNRERVVTLYSTFKSEHNNVSNGASLILEKGDVVDVYLPANRRVLDNQNHHTTFRGHLLFQICL